MVCYTQDQRFFGTLPIIWYSTKHKNEQNISEIRCFPPQVKDGQHLYCSLRSEELTSSSVTEVLSKGARREQQNG
jgi:hypothetical protein